MSEYAVKITETGKNNHEKYIDNIKVEDIIAFKISENTAISAKVYGAEFNFGKIISVTCATKNGVIYQVPRSAIIWVKTGARWPRFVMDLFGRKKDR